MFSEGKAKSQSRAVITAISYVLNMAWQEKKPADRVLSSYFHQHRELGSRDRRVISEAFFSLCRWWGWLKKIAPDNTSAPENDWFPVICGALLMENIQAPMLLRLWLEQNKKHLSVLRNIPSKPQERFLWIAHLLGFHKTKGANPKELIPSWTLSEINCDKSVFNLISWLQKRPPLWLRIQKGEPEKIIHELEQQDLNVKRHNFIKNAVALYKTGINLMDTPLYREGDIEVQDISSQAVGIICSPKAGQRWWDVCAGGGGKTLLLAQLMNGKGVIIASDKYSFKLEEMRRRAKRAGFSNISTWNWKGKKLPKEKAIFDGVLVDAPCSGSGTWRRNPAARWNIAKADLKKFSELQFDILLNAASGVKPGGILVYATCSMFREENEDVLKKFLTANPFFELDPFINPLTQKSTEGYIQIWPWDGDCDSMFVARMKNITQ